MLNVIYKFGYRVVRNPKSTWIVYDTEQTPNTIVGKLTSLRRGKYPWIFDAFPGHAFETIDDAIWNLATESGRTRAKVGKVGG